MSMENESGNLPNGDLPNGDPPSGDLPNGDLPNGDRAIEPEDGTLASEFYRQAGEPGGEESPPMTPEEEAALLRLRLNEANEEVARQIDAVQRGQADLVNARRRYDEERLNVQRHANSRMLVNLLPIVDELDLALGHLDKNSTPEQESAAQSWVDGVRLIQRKLGNFLESEGVVRIESLGEPFNPELHEAVGIAQDSEVDSGLIVQVLRQGYRLHERVVQPAQVVVNQ